MDTDLSILNFGEKRLNQGCIVERDNLMNSFQNKKEILENFQKTSNMMEEKIGINDDLSRKISEINEKLALKEKYLSNEGEEIKNLKKRKIDLKVKSYTFIMAF